jgi:hypothetical protein
LIGVSGEVETHHFDRMRADIDAGQWFRASEPHRLGSHRVSIVAEGEPPMPHGLTEIGAVPISVQ